MNWQRVQFFVLYAAAIIAAAYFYQSYMVGLYGLLAFLAVVLLRRPLARFWSFIMPLKSSYEVIEKYNKLAGDITAMLAQRNQGPIMALEVWMRQMTKDLYDVYKAEGKTLFAHELQFDAYIYLMPRFVFDVKGKEVGDLFMEASNVALWPLEDKKHHRRVHALYYPLGNISDVTRHFGDVHSYFDGLICPYTGKRITVYDVNYKPSITIKYETGGQKIYNRMMQVIIGTDMGTREEMQKAYDKLLELTRGRNKEPNAYWRELARTYDLNEVKVSAPIQTKRVALDGDRWFHSHAGNGGHLRDGWIYFGDNLETGEPFWIPIKRLTHYLVSGMSGSGKSVFLHQFLAGVAYNEEYFQDVYLIDLKGGVELWRYNGEANDLFHVVYKYSEVIETVDGLNELMDERLDDMRERGLRDWDGPKIIVVIDEYASLSYEVPEDKEAKALQTKMLARLSRLSSKSRAAGIILWAQLQKGTTDVMDSGFRNNLQSEIMFKQKSKLQAAAVFGATDELKVDPTRMNAGEFVMLDGGTGELLYLKGRKLREIG